MTPLRRFCHSLALRLGVRVREIESWPMSELADWLEYNRTNPIDDGRGDFHAALISANVIRAAGGRCSVSDFVPEWGKEKRDMTEDEIRAVAERIARGTKH